MGTSGQRTLTSAIHYENFFSIVSIFYALVLHELDLPCVLRCRVSRVCLPSMRLELHVLLNMLVAVVFHSLLALRYPIMLAVLICRRRGNL